MTTTHSMSKRRTLLHTAVAMALCTAGSFSPTAQAAEGWDWMVAPYLWAVGFDTDLERTVPPTGGISSDTSFDGVVDKLDGAFQIHVEGQGDNWGMFSDFTYLGLADGKDFDRFDTESDLDARLFELAAVWSPGDDRFSGLDVFAGLRYLDVDFTVTFDPTDPAFGTSNFQAGDSFADFMIGARYTWAFSDRWSFTARTDGSFGDTEGTWNLSGVLAYKTGSGAWLLGYRYLTGEFETGNSNTELTLSGLEVGYGFRF